MHIHQKAAAHADKFALFTSTSDLYLVDGAAPPVGANFRNPDLARTYREIAAGGVQAFYTGAIAAAANHPPTAAGIAVVGARMSLADLQDYEVRFREPIRSTYRGFEVVGMPLPSSGGIAVAEALNILETFDFAGQTRSEIEHLYLEASRLAFADRNAYVGDAEFVNVPVTGLIAKAFARRQAALIDPDEAGAIAAARDPFPFQNDPSIPLRPDASNARETEHTTHFAVCDREGSIMACTFTIESFGGRGIVVPGRGFLLNNEPTDFDFSGPHPNVPEARKRPRSSMSPTIVFRAGRPVVQWALRRARGFVAPV